ncbi:glycoside hydrolase family 2 protein, partial [Cellulomonas rhizosphaerae]
AAPFTASAEAVEGGYVVTVEARSLVRDLTLHVDRLDPAAVVDAALITLPAGATARVNVRTGTAGLEGVLVTAPVLRTANDLVAARASVG